MGFISSEDGDVASVTRYSFLQNGKITGIPQGHSPLNMLYVDSRYFDIASVGFRL